MTGGNGSEETLCEGEESLEGFGLSVSHASLTGKIRPIGRSGSISWAYSPYGGQLKQRIKH